MRVQEVAQSIGKLSHHDQKSSVWKGTRLLRAGATLQDIVQEAET